MYYLANPSIHSALIDLFTLQPHLNWDFPKEFLDKIPVNVPPALHRAFPADVPSIGWHECAECSNTGSYSNDSM
jgi:hypothetical protein